MLSESKTTKALTSVYLAYKHPVNFGKRWAFHFMSQPAGVVVYETILLGLKLVTGNEARDALHRQTQVPVAAKHVGLAFYETMFIGSKF